MFLEIISPEKTIYSGEVNSVAVPGAQGEFEMLNNHAAIVSSLKKGYIKIYGDIKLDDSTKDMFEKGPERGFFLPINSGTVELKENKVTVLVE